jgi:hypothetical protein
VGLLDKDSYRQEIERAFLGAKALMGEGNCLWPAPYDQPTYESRIAFLYDKVWTFEETSGQPMALARKNYIEWFTWHWGNTKDLGEPLVVEKSRRMVISNICRALELHGVGIRTGNVVIADQVFSRARYHCWRTWFSYDQLVSRNPDWKLSDALPYGSLADQRLDSLVLPNGSIIRSVNQDPESFRGTGVAEAVLEEGSVYDRLAKTWAQANSVTQGPPGKIGGHSVIIANASPNQDWSEIKAKMA